MPGVGVRCRANKRGAPGPRIGLLVLALLSPLILAPPAGAAVTFEKVSLASATGKPFTSVAIGPDGKLYAGTLTGEIVRFPLNSNGTTGTAEVITSVQAANGGSQRMLIGLAFDPAATAGNLVLWVTHSAYAFTGGPDWTGKVTRLSGPNLATVQDYVVGLPRSARDHLTNSLAFGPDGALYFTPRKQQRHGRGRRNLGEPAGAQAQCRGAAHGPDRDRHTSAGREDRGRGDLRSLCSACPGHDLCERDPKRI